jgi:hypothetical protein
VRTEPGLPRPDIQLHFVVGLVDDHARKRHFATGYSCIPVCCGRRAGAQSACTTPTR